MRRDPFRDEAVAVARIARAGARALASHELLALLGIVLNGPTLAVAGGLPYGSLPRLLMLWMYAECERTGQGTLDLVYALSDYLLELELEETPELDEQAQRLFACGLHVVERVIPVVQASMIQWVGEDAPFRAVAPLRATQVELSDALCEEMRLGQAPLCLHTVRAIQDSPFALEVYLWERCYRTRDLPGAPPAHSRLARYHALAERPLPRPSPAEVCAFEGELHEARKRLAQLRKEVVPPAQFDDDLPF